MKLKTKLKPIRYEKDCMKIKFELYDDLPLDNVLNIPLCVVIVRSAFQENYKYYPQIYLKNCFSEYDPENKADSYVVC